MSSQLQRQAIWSEIVEQRVFASIVLSLAIGTALNIAAPFPIENEFLRYVEFQRPAVYAFLFWTHRLFLYTTPLIMLSAIGSIAYTHGRSKMEATLGGRLPLYPDIKRRNSLFVVSGEVHNQLHRKPSPSPQWLSIPEKGLYTGIAVFGSIASGETQAAILPLSRIGDFWTRPPGA